MKVFSVCGISDSGKTTTIEEIIKELKERKYKVGSLKEIHYETFEIDPKPTSNTRRHREAGSELVTARGYSETDILYQEKLPMYDILPLYHEYDWVVLEGVDDINIPTIVTAHDIEGIEVKISPYTFLISGKISEKINEYKNIPAISALNNIKEIVDIIEEKTYDLLPNFSPKCCKGCGFTCETLGEAILNGKAKREDCIIDTNIELIIGGKKINMVPFVQSILKNTILGVVKELDGYNNQLDIEIRL